MTNVNAKVTHPTHHKKWSKTTGPLVLSPIDAADSIEDLEKILHKPAPQEEGDGQVQRELNPDIYRLCTPKATAKDAYYKSTIATQQSQWVTGENRSFKLTYVLEASWKKATELLTKADTPFQETIKTSFNAFLTNVAEAVQSNGPQYVAFKSSMMGIIHEMQRSLGEDVDFHTVTPLSQSPKIDRPTQATLKAAYTPEYVAKITKKDHLEALGEDTLTLDSLQEAMEHYEQLKSLAALGKHGYATCSAKQLVKQLKAYDAAFNKLKDSNPDLHRVYLERQETTIRTAKETPHVVQVSHPRHANRCEDTFYSERLPTGATFDIVADGMGGHALGEVAARIVTSSLKDTLRGIAQEANGKPVNPQEITKELKKAAQTAEEALKKALSPFESGAAVTFSLSIVDEQGNTHRFVSFYGDCEAVLVGNNGQTKRLNPYYKERENETSAGNALFTESSITDDDGDAIHYLGPDVKGDIYLMTDGIVDNGSDSLSELFSIDCPQKKLTHIAASRAILKRMSDKGKPDDMVLLRSGTGESVPKALTQSPMERLLTITEDTEKEQIKAILRDCLLEFEHPNSPLQSDRAQEREEGPDEIAQMKRFFAIKVAEATDQFSTVKDVLSELGMTDFPSGTVLEDLKTSVLQESWHDKKLSKLFKNIQRIAYPLMPLTVSEQEAIDGVLENAVESIKSTLLYHIATDTEIIYPLRSEITKQWGRLTEEKQQNAFYQACELMGCNIATSANGEAFIELPEKALKKSKSTQVKEIRSYMKQCATDKKKSAFFPLDKETFSGLIRQAKVLPNLNSRGNTKAEGRTLLQYPKGSPVRTVLEQLGVNFEEHFVKGSAETLNVRIVWDEATVTQLPQWLQDVYAIHKAPTPADKETTRKSVAKKYSVT